MKIKEKTFKSKDNKDIFIREVLEADAGHFLSLGKSIMSEDIYSLTRADELTMTVEQEREWLKSSIKNPNHLILVAEVDGKIIGQLDFSNGDKKRIAHTGDFGMGVHKDYRGLGVGGLLLQALIDWAKENSTIEKINLCVHQTNSRAISMYEKIGFVKEGLRTKDLKYPNNEYVDTVLMGLQI